STEVHSFLVFSSHNFVKWGMENPRKDHSRIRRYKPDPLKFIDFWFDIVMHDLRAEVGHSAVEMANQVIGLARRITQNPKKAMNEQEAEISGLKRSITRHAIALSDHGVDVDEVVDFVRYNYVNKIISQ